MIQSDSFGPVHLHTESFLVVSQTSHLKTKQKMPESKQNLQVM